MHLISRVEFVPGDLGHGASERLEIIYQRLVDQNITIDKEKSAFNGLRFP